MEHLLSTLVSTLENSALCEAQALQWGSPVPAFGDPGDARVATLGLNPSNREFVDQVGAELDGASRRFHTLGSLGLKTWSDAKPAHIAKIADSCRRYFDNNPYDRWFGELEFIINGMSASFYGDGLRACHLDLVPFATECKWGELSSWQRHSLLDESGSTLGSLLRDSSIRVVVLNGKSVVSLLSVSTGVEMATKRMDSWTLPRRSGLGVAGFAYRAQVSSLCGIELGREVLLLGYNHNLQSSFGVTKGVRKSIRRWVARQASEVL